MKFALYFGNRGFFPERLIASAREEMIQVVESLGHEALLPDPSLTRYGAVETAEEGYKYAAFLAEHKGQYDGVILCLPNFGDENGAIAALRDCGVPILIQAYPDEIGKMDFDSRRDAFCGKFSIMDVFYQYQLPFTVFEPHVAHPLSTEFAQNLADFAAVCRIANGMKRVTVGAIGARTTAFKTVRFDELTLQTYGITVESLDLSEIILRVNQLSETDPKIIAKVTRLTDYADFSKAPQNKVVTLAKISVAIDDLIAQYRMDCIALRCWEEIEKIFGVSPCVLLSELNDRGIAAACELDVCNAVMMHALQLASGKPAMCLDWNNNYGTDPNKCILFHCGPIAQTHMVQKGEVIDHKMFAKSYGQGCGWGCNIGRIAAFPFAYTSAKTEKGKLVLYVGEGEFTPDPIEKEFFGCGGVARIDDLQSKLVKIGRNGFRHHVSATSGRYERALREAFQSYLKYEIVEI